MINDLIDSRNSENELSLEEDYEEKIRIQNLADREQRRMAYKFTSGNERLRFEFERLLSMITALERQTSLTPELEQKLANVQESIEILDDLYFQQWENYSDEIFDLKNEICELNALVIQKDQELDAINRSRGYRIIRRLRRIRNFIFPAGSKFGKFCRLVYHTPSYIKRGYPGKLIHYIRQNGLKNIKKNISRVMNSGIGSTSEHDYDIWIANNEPTENELAEQKNANFSYAPLISIIVPVYNTPIPFLEKLLNSVLDQTYGNWELCLADGDSENKDEIRQTVEKPQDKRIKYHLCEKNLGISGNTNAALALATGDFVAFADHDDTLAPFALFELVNCINHCSGVDFIYSDDDRISVGDERSAPCFKPDFSIDRLRTCNYVGHLTSIMKSLVDAVGPLDSRYDGSQDYDLVLRATEKAKRIEHIPKILYHWRMHENSVSMNTSAKVYAYDAAKLAISAHLSRVGLVGEVSDGYITNSYKIDYAIIGEPKVSIVIPTMDHICELKTCLDSILGKSTYKNYQIVLVENNSTKAETFEYYKSLSSNPSILIAAWKKKGFNYSALINYGIMRCSGEYVITLNNDTEIITPNWIEEMLMFAQRDDVGMVGARLLYPDNTVWNAGVALDSKHSVTLLHNKIDKGEAGYYGQSVIVQNFSALAGACLLFRKNFYLEVGGCDEKTFPVAHNDMDLSLKMIKKGKVLVYTPFAQLYHHESKSRGSDMVGENLHRFLVEDQQFLYKWKEYLKFGDPFYNLNLKVGEMNFQIRTDKVHYKY